MTMINAIKISLCQYTEVNDTKI